ncbi:hypothetical protein IFM89_027972 [Coptis chinensis]|uniref:Anoctamin transmembrane domain-containing protein n=1 Tax=Coptis chinensis TaxID=261450 RepID=A0A835IHX6_9MAGN|nr:hypothetical protein IFM89_027972 [Coptis chinensis]
MHGNEEKQTGFEIGVVVSKKEGNESFECVEFLVLEFNNVGLVIERVVGLSEEFIKVAAPLETLGRAAAELQIKKPTYIGMDLQFEWDEVEAFVRQPDGSLFSWCERFCCFTHLLYGIINKTESVVTLMYNNKVINWRPGESLVKKLESEGIVKKVFPLHDETKRKQLMRTWALNWLDMTNQPIDEIYTYFGTKVIATYFAFLGMYTRWMLFPAALALTLQLIDFGSRQLLMLPIFFIFVTLWAVIFFQFWKRKSAALLARWQIGYTVGVDTGFKYSDTERSSLQSHMEHIRKMGTDKIKEKAAFQRDEWSGHLLRFRNDALVILSIICLQLPFELAYAHLYELVSSDIVKFGLTALYIFTIQYLTKIGGKVSVKLIKNEKNKSSEHRADSLVYKVFGLYFMQSYIGVFYHALLHRNFTTLRLVLTQRLIVSQVLENLLENSIPYLKYRLKKYRAVHKKKLENGLSMGKVQVTTRVEKEYMKPSYSQVLVMNLKMVYLMHNITEIRTDALKLLAMLKRPIPRASATIGAWLNIFQFLIVMSICTNSVLLVCLYDQEGKWKIEPGLAAILIIEHVLLLIKFGVSKFVPEEPAWVKANRVKNAAQAQDMCSKQLLRSISGEKKRE